MSKVIFNICLIYVFIRNVDGKEIHVTTKIPTAGSALPHIGTSVADQPKASIPPATPAGKDTFPKRTKPPAALPFDDVKPWVYPDQLLFKAETITNFTVTAKAKTTTALANTLRPSLFGATPITTEKESINYRISGQRRDDSIQNQIDMPAPPGSPQPLEPPEPTSTKMMLQHSPLMPAEGDNDSYTFGDVEWVTDKDAEWILQYLQGITKKFPKTTQLIEVGKSKNNFPIYAVEITHKMASGATIVIDAGYDASDRLGISLAVYIIYQFLDNLTENLITLMGVKIVVVPLINPDSYENSIQDKVVERCRENLFSSFEIGEEPVDPCPGFFQDVETIALSQYYQTLTKLKLYFSIDSGTPAIGYPFGYSVNVDNKSREMAENMGHVVSDNLDKNVGARSLSGIFGQIDGTAIDWVHSKLEVPYCVYISLERVVEESARINIVKAHFESLRYGILQLQLTDPEIAQAIYDDFDALSRGQTFFISVGVLMLIIIGNVWFQ